MRSSRPEADSANKNVTRGRTALADVDPPDARLFVALSSSQRPIAQQINNVQGGGSSNGAALNFAEIHAPWSGPSQGHGGLLVKAKAVWTCRALWMAASV